MTESPPGVPLHTDRDLLRELLRRDGLYSDSVVVQGLAERIATEAGDWDAPTELLLGNLHASMRHLAAAIAVLTGRTTGKVPVSIHLHINPAALDLPELAAPGRSLVTPWPE